MRPLFFALILSCFAHQAFAGPIAFWNGASPAYVQSQWNEVAGAMSSLAKAFDANNTTGNLIVVYCHTWTATAPAQTVTDTRGNSYTNILTQNVGTGRVMVFYAKNVSAGANTVTCNFGLTENTGAGIFISEYSGLSKTAPLDVSFQNTGTGGTSSLSVTTTQPYDLVIQYSNEARTGALNGFVFRRAVADGVGLAERIQPAAGVVNGGYTFSGTPTWYDIMIAFKK